MAGASLLEGWIPDGLNETGRGAAKAKSSQLFTQPLERLPMPHTAITSTMRPFYRTQAIQTPVNSTYCYDTDDTALFFQK
jgi:hypothetical protein